MNKSDSSLYFDDGANQELDREKVIRNFLVLANFISALIAAASCLVLPTNVDEVMKEIAAQYRNTKKTSVKQNRKKERERFNLEEGECKNRFQFYESCVGLLEDILELIKLPKSVKRSRALDAVLAANGASKAAIVKRLKDAAARWREWLCVRSGVIETNVAFVYSVVTNYIGIARTRGVSIDDLASSGKLGLMIAVDNFDVYRGYAFTTFASYWVNREIHNCLLNDYPIKIPSGQKKALTELFNAQNDYFKRYGRFPSPDEIAMASGSKQSLGNSYQLAALKAGCVGELDARYEEDQRYTLGDLIPGPENMRPDLQCIANEQIELLRTAISELRDRERLIIAVKYSFDLDAPFLNLKDYINKLDQENPGFKGFVNALVRERSKITDVEMCELFGKVSRQRVNQILKAAEQKLREKLANLCR